MRTNPKNGSVTSPVPRRGTTRSKPQSKEKTTSASQADVVENSDALGVVPRALLGRLRQRSSVATLPFEPSWLRTEQGLMWRRDRMAHPALKPFRDAARRSEAAVMGKTASGARE